MTKAPKSNPPLLSYVEEHIPYEIWMLRWSHGLLVVGHAAFGPVVKNALIESFAMHARNLLELFKGSGQSISVTDLAPTFIRCDFPREWLDKIARQIAHLHPKRDTLPKLDAEDRDLILARLVAEAKTFVALLSPDYADRWDPAGLLADLK